MKLIANAFQILALGIRIGSDANGRLGNASHLSIEMVVIIMMPITITIFQWLSIDFKWEMRSPSSNHLDS